MKIKIDGKDFREKLKIIVGGFDPADTSSYIAFSVQNEKLIVFAETISSYCKISTDIIEKDEGELNIFVEGETLKTLASIIPPIPITVTAKENEMVFKFNKNTLKLPIFVGNPLEKHQPVVEKIGSVSADSFIRTLKESFKVASREAVVESMKCSNLHFSKNSITICSTDSYVLLKEVIPYDNLNTEKTPSQVLIKYTEIPLLTSISPGLQMLDLYYGSGKFGYQDNDGNLILVGYSAFKAFPYSVVENALGTGIFMKIKKTDLKPSIDVISKLTILDSRDIKVGISENSNSEKELEIVGARGNKVYVPIEETNATELDSLFVIEVLLKGINICNSSDLYFEWSEESVPYGVFGMIGDTKDTSKTIVVMPKVN